MNQVETLKAIRRVYGEEVLIKGNQNGNALHAACEAGEQAIDAIIYLLEEVKVPINSLDDQKNTPLHKAAEIGSYNVLVYLLDQLLNKIED